MGRCDKERGKTEMNKLDIIIGFINSALMAGKEIDLVKIFEMVEDIERIAVDRGYISLKFCPRCKDEITIVNLSTTGGGQYRASCKCRSESGTSARDLMKRWLLND